jgi:uncharacterized glyoxalase superfamily protein PhnB
MFMKQLEHKENGRDGAAAMGRADDRLPGRDRGIGLVGEGVRVRGTKAHHGAGRQIGRRLGHGEMIAGKGLIMLARPTPNYEGPRQHRAHCERAKAWSTVPWVIDGVLVYVDDVDAHFARASEAGALILSPPEAGPPARRYRAEDLEGHRWMFMEQPR